MSNSKERLVFIVDDDPQQLQMLEDHLNDSLKVRVKKFSTGEQCLQNLDENPNVVILDYYLDSVDKKAQNGIAILKQIKAKLPNTDVIMLSGQDKIDVAIETMKNGAFDYVVKNESSFVRAENAVVNVFKGISLQENLRGYKLATWFLAASIGIILILAAILTVTGHVSNPGWW
jgi:DNA-binding NtrC family response regulator